MKNIILAIDRVEPGLVEACHKIAKDLQIEMRGIALVDSEFKKTGDFLADSTGFFKEIECDFNDPKQLQIALKPFQDDILAVHCRIETGMQDFAKLIPFIPYTPAPSSESIHWATDKSLMRDRLSTFNENIAPKYRKVTANDLSKIDEIIEGMDYPIIVKPRGLNSSMLVSKCANREELLNCLETTFSLLKDVYKRERGSGEPGLLIEEYMQGSMFSTDAYVSPGGQVECLPPVHVVTTDQLGMDGFYAYKYEVLYQDVNEIEDINGLYDAARASVKALNLRACTAHIELYNCNGKWKIIELGARIGGHRTDIYSMAFGIDHYYNDLASRINGLRPVIPENTLSYTVCIDVYPQETGKLLSYEGLDVIENLSSFKKVERLADIGSNVYSAEEGSSFLCVIYLSNTDKEQLESDADLARKIASINIG